MLLVVTLTSRAYGGDRDPWFGRDKKLHFGASAALAVTGYGVAAVTTESRTLRTFVGVSSAAVAGVGKELIDLAGYGDPSWKDLTWDGIGCAVGIGIALLVDVLVRGPHPTTNVPSTPSTLVMPSQGLTVRW